jgi:hypothetical protein
MLNGGGQFGQTFVFGRELRFLLIESKHTREKS